MAKRQESIGLWIIGACGGVGATVAIGLAALRKRRPETTGLVTAVPPFSTAGLIDPRNIVFGGHDIRAESLLQAIRGLHQRAGVFDADLIARSASILRNMQRNIRPGTLIGADDPIKRLTDDARVKQDRTPAGAVARLARDIQRFRERHRLARVIVVNLASCERHASRARTRSDFSKLEVALKQRGPSPIPASSIYALAALESGCAYVNFTPSLGMELPPLRQRAESLQLPYMGRDGKTGETLVKSALAPMFAMRNLYVHAWVGQNILGNRDGALLADPRTRQAKIKSKNRAVSKIVRGNPQTTVSIDYVPSLDDWKVAWDFIHFEGFLGTKMSMQFTWQGCDSVLAAPLVIDLARLADLEMRRGAVGPMKHLAFFFKDPTGVEHHDLPTQWAKLIEHVTNHRSSTDTS